MALKKRVFGLDSFIAKPVESMMAKVIKPGENFGLESDMVMGTDVNLKNISASQYRDLLNGVSYLEFWIEAIDHTKPTANNRLYEEEEFKKGMDAMLLRVIRNGGLQPGEWEHPEIKIDPKLSEDENMKNIMSRLLRFDTNLITHYIVNSKTENGKTYWLIRTSMNNVAIVKDIALGKVPTFSIRTLGDFPMINGVLVGKNLIVITADYVYNPANQNSRILSSNAKFVDPANATEVKFELVEKIGNESVELFKLKDNEKMMFAIESDNTITLNIYEKVDEKTMAQLTNEVFSSIF